MAIRQILPYIIVGDPILAKWLARWLLHFKLNLEHDEDGNMPTAFVWPDEYINIKGHDTSGNAVRVNIRECMEYLTKGHGANKILEDPNIRDHKELLMKFASAKTAVDLFDEKTWGGKDYNSLVETVDTMIAIHASQNQGVKSYVKSTAIVRRTNVEEARSAAWVLIHSVVI